MPDLVNGNMYESYIVLFVMYHVIWGYKGRTGIGGVCVCVCYTIRLSDQALQLN